MNPELKPRRHGKQNLVFRLRTRELSGGLPTGTVGRTQREIYRNIFPNMTVVNVEKPQCFLRKFSPDGQCLIAFSTQQNGLEVYSYKGVTAAGQLLHQLSGVMLCNDAEYSSLEIRKNLFQALFSLRHSVSLIEVGATDQLNRECSLFTEDSRHVILASSTSAIQEDRYPSLTEIHQNNESLPPTSTFILEDIWIYSVDIQEGRLCDKKQFKCDKIFLAHNQGLYLHQRLLAILSVQHQTIHLIQIEEATGQLVPLQSIGRFLYDDDEFLIESALCSPRRDVHPSSEEAIAGLKHRILAFLYKKAARESAESGSQFSLRNFYQKYDLFRKLKILRMQLLDRERILLRMASEDVAALRVELNAQNSVFVVYDMRTTEIVDIFESVSPRLLEIYESCADYFRHPDRTVRFPCSMSSSEPARWNHDRYKQTILHARGGGITEVTRRVLAQLPVGAQSFSGSPYLDLNLFSYDDKLVSILERPRTAGDTAVKFYDRKTEKLKFQLYCGLTNRGGMTPQLPNQRPLVAFVFHPSDPFAISVQRNHRDYIVNFHLRACNIGPEGTDWTPELSRITTAF